MPTLKNGIELKNAYSSKSSLSRELTSSRELHSSGSTSKWEPSPKKGGPSSTLNKFDGKLKMGNTEIVECSIK